MTYPQFKSAVSSVAKKLKWQIKLAYATVSTEGIKEEDIPLYSETRKEEDRVMRMSDALMLQSMVGK